jgi:MFS family permease
VSIRPAGSLAMNEATSPTPSPPDDVRFNVTVNILDGAFFGVALGFASFTTIIPLFVRQLTDSPELIGLIPAIHSVGWQLPQLLTAGRVRRLTRFKPMVMTMTVFERVPFLGLAVVAYLLPKLEPTFALMLIYVLLIWQGLGGGFTATVWQSMIGKIIPPTWHGRFFGVQGSAANLLMGITAIFAGQILERFESPQDYVYCFLLASAGLALSFIFLGLTREQDHTPAYPSGIATKLWQEVGDILSSDRIFRRFLLIRMILQLGGAAFSFYAVYAVGELGVSEALVGWLTGVIFFSQVIANPTLGALGDRTNHRFILLLGSTMAMLSAGLAGWVTAIPLWFVVFGLAGMGAVANWTTSMVLSLEFGTHANQATYIGMANSLIAPATLLAPFLAAWCIDNYGYTTMFRASALVFFIAAVINLSLLRLEPNGRNQEAL